MIDVPVGRKPANTGPAVIVTECDYGFMILMLFIAVFVQFFCYLDVVFRYVIFDGGRSPAP